MPSDPSALSALRHDLRTPINHILGYSELLAEDITDETQSADLQKIQSAARTLLEIINSRLSDNPGGSPAEPVASPAAAPHLRSSSDSEADAVPAHSPCGHILVVDDDAGNRDTLSRRLEKEGHSVSQAGSGTEALALLEANPFDLVLLDILMPGMDGHEVLARIKSRHATRHVPVIMISALDELNSVIRCIEAGAEDYLPKPFEPTLLRARINASLEKKALRDTEQAHLMTIEETSRRLSEELGEAVRYVESMLPAPTDVPLLIRWSFETSTELGGDAFGYHWLDDRHYAIYLLDVCGHGVGAALLSVAASNFLRSQALPDTDFLSPSAVLSALNETFEMEKHNNMYFTIWYGVFDTVERTLRHAAGGHPPAILLAPERPPELVVSSGMIIGAIPNAAFPEATTAIPPGARLLVYSDGAYELALPDGTMLGFDDFATWADTHARSPAVPEDVVARARHVTAQHELADDISVLYIDFA